MDASDRELSPGGAPDRGVSEVIGIALLFGFVIAGAALVVVTGTSAQNQISEQSRYESAIGSVEELDASLADLSVRSDSSAVSFEITDRVGDEESVRVDTTDQLTIRFHDGTGYTGACEATVPLDRVDYEVNDRTVISYQAGGVFVTQDGSTVVDTPPDVGLTEGTVKSSVFDLPADLTHEFTASRDVEGSVQQTKQALRNLFATQDCNRPDGVKLIVESERAGGWERYFESRLGDVSGVTVSTPAADRVEVEMPERVLLDAVNDSRNRVVAFNESGPDAYGTVVRNGSGVDIVVDKPADDNRYGLTAQVLGGDVGYNESHRHEKEVPDYKWVWDPGSEEPLDVVFLMDESGSMSSQQISDTKAAVKQFTSRLQSDNKSHKAALVGYSGSHGGNTKVHQGLTSNLGDVKSAASGLSDSGGTPMDDGLEEAMSELGQDPNRSEVIIMMTDGEPNGGAGPYDPSCGRPLGGSTSPSDNCPVADAIDKGYKVYTVTFGSDSDVNKGLMKDVAADTDAEYDHVYKGEGEELDDTFENLIGKGENYSYRVPNGTDTYYITDIRGVLHEPVTVEHTHDGKTWGDSGSPVADAVHQEYGGRVETPGLLTDGEKLTTEVERYTCDVNKSGERTLVDREWGYRTNNSSAAQYPYNDAVRGDFDDHYNEYRCAGPGLSSVGGAADVHVAVAGDPVSSVTDGGTPVGWQRRVADIVDPYTSGGTFDLQSNQVVVVYEFADAGSHDTNGLVMLYEVGYSTKYEVNQVLDLDVTEVEEST